MERTKILQLITLILEAVLAIPILGGTIIISTVWSILGIALILHIVTLAMALQDKRQYYGSIVGIVASVLGWVPFLGWALHTAAAVTLLINFLQKK